ncbi:sucrose-6-phosphate hydrolase [Intestinibaculum porci]|uniref:sucrose-6-phosphate hydrolase n=1 Tax=Intestinibaculum porci TaxID=2487118 RepID=UPI002408FC97|nr:sucrose-6-phosphate hydrolase [Intestinibaculum porci]MDD6349698.1 sucrose-6-phosphate hydrolase [Intestinibaculum porci]
MKQWTKEERYRVLQSPDEIIDLHRQIVKSPYRQHYHIQPITGLLNDPNGFVYHNGYWHLFYQWCPWGAVHGLKYWYEVQSEDLIHWINMGVGIKPDHDFDNKGAYSGSALVTEQSIYLYYTGNHRDENWQRTPYTCLVNMRDDGSLHKYSKPLFGPSPNYTEHQRDPKIIYHKENKTYYIMLGAQSRDHHGRIIFYKSKTFNKDYEFAGELKVEGYEDFGDMWECPSIEHIGDVDVLIFCPQHLKLKDRGNSIHHNGYLIGHMDYETLTFHHDGSFHVLDFGFDSYAAECCANIGDDNKAVLIAWMGLPDASYPTDDEDWSGCLTMPRELTIQNRRLIQKPLKGFEDLRQETLPLATKTLPTACELDLHITGALDMQLCKSDDHDGLTIRYEPVHRTITIDRSHMHKRFNIEQGESRMRQLHQDLNHLRIFIDASSIEIYVNDGEALFTSRIFPTKDEHGLVIKGQVEGQIYALDRAVKDNFQF